jgi:hypothetical protein
MRQVFGSSAPSANWFLSGPMRLSYYAFGIGLVGLAAREVFDNAFGTLLYVVLLLASLLTAGSAVWWRLGRRHEDDLDERSKSAVLMISVSLTVLLAAQGMPSGPTDDWDSLRTATMVLWCIASFSIPVLLLPSIGRRIVASLVILFHFGGIITATTAVTLPNNAQLPYIPTLLWNHVYRPYLTFMYLNNAYHFYSPEPGPPTLVWFLVKFDDNTHKWIKIVQREDYATRQQYQRMLSLTESVNQFMPTPVNKLNVLGKRRQLQGELTPFKDRDKRPLFVPMSDVLSLDMQYREPTKLAKDYLKSYATYVCRTTRSDENPNAAVKSVKVYRLIHHLIQPGQMQGGLSPKDPTFFWAYFQGEYTPKGELMGNPFPVAPQDREIAWFEMNAEGFPELKKEIAPDPFLYWMLPIKRDPKPEILKPTKIEHYNLTDTLSIHAHPGEYLKWDLD